MASATQLIYQRFGERILHAAQVLSVVPISALPAADQALVKDATDIEHAVITDSTIFHVQGGGQPSDTGTMTSPAEPEAPNGDTTFEVKSVRHPAEGGQVLHFGRFIQANGATAHFSTDLNLYQHVDAEKRKLYSRLHSGGHIMSLAIHTLCREGIIPGLKESKASHYPDSAAVTFEGTIEAKHKDAIQAKTDEYVKSARPIKIHWWPMEELLEKCYASEGFALPKGESMGRVVEMEGLGSYPCGGTHVQDCSQVGKIEVKKISRSKGTNPELHLDEDSRGELPIRESCGVPKHRYLSAHPRLSILPKSLSSICSRLSGCVAKEVMSGRADTQQAALQAYEHQ
nr:alanyl-trna editing protein alax-m [Quercus suber]